MFYLFLILLFITFKQSDSAMPGLYGCYASKCKRLVFYYTLLKMFDAITSKNDIIQTGLARRNFVPISPRKNTLLSDIVVHPDTMISNGLACWVRVNDRSASSYYGTGFLNWLFFYYVAF